MQYPDDDNGKMLTAMADAGIDLSKALDIDFFLVFDDQRDAESALEGIQTTDLDGEVELLLNDESGKWELIVCLNMLPEYDALVSQESHLNDFSGEFGGVSDGWGVMQHQDGDDEFMDDDHEHGTDCKH
ncbi:ribonuclease E inhibitor RraB [Shewanella surugensis]|uniref:Ribonuclease E inhibitor RraB n=1 Tax=Shewanella surugensis TaxID=212020 RepID=A0ABT0LCH1_9GAMM|nr:ribonuclease E inhibitor RraB [Shewanella surugensis]MCL1125402.1 ribonuclease E inhibitor RraB [Shewanella surugensis]